MNKTQIILGILAIITVIAIAFFIKYAQVKIFFGGDMRCVFVECRINK